MHTKFLNKLFALMGTVAIFAIISTGCGGDGTPKVVAKDIDVAALMDQLMSDKNEERFNALIELGDGRENAAPAIDLVLEILTDDKDPKIREMAAYVLMNMGEKAGKPAIPTLKEAFKNEKNPTVKINIRNAWDAIEPGTAHGTGTPQQP